MDPLSLSASIAGLVSLADLVFRAGTKYVRAVIGSKEEVEGLVKEVKGLSILLHDLSLVAFDLDYESILQQTAVEPNSCLNLRHLHDCREVLRSLEKVFTDTKMDLDSSSSLTRIKGQLKWPFSSTKTKEILQDLQRQKQTINIAISAKSLKMLEQCLSQQEDAKNKAADLRADVKKILDIQTKVVLDKKKQEVRKFFMKANPSSEFETVRNLRHPMTGLWLTNGTEFGEWYNTPGSKIWLTGIPGAGKSVIAGAIISECIDRNEARTAIAYFFCTYRDKATQLCSNILSSLCLQLALQDDGAFRILHEYYDELQVDAHSPSQPAPKRLLEVLQKICDSFSRVYLIIDGLDECEDQVDTNLTNMLSLASKQSHDVISLALLSRDEVAIRERLESHFHCVEIEAHTEDIQLYVAAELTERMNSKRLRLRDVTLKDQIMSKLVGGAKGMFRWVACQLDHICALATDRGRREALEKLPPTLPATYERILMKVESQPNEMKFLVQKALLLISSRLDMPSRRCTKLTFRQICEAVSLLEGSNILDKDDVVEEQEILRLCGSLVRTRKSDDDCIIEFAHFTVQEYLENECKAHHALAGYSISQEKAYDMLGTISLGFVTLKNHDRPLKEPTVEIDLLHERRDQMPFYEHAALFWPNYLFTVNQSRHYHELDDSKYLQDLFQVQKTTNFCVWVIEVLSHCLYSRDGKYEAWTECSEEADEEAFIEVLKGVMRPDFTPLHMAAALGLTQTCRRLLSEGAQINCRSKFGTPLHLAVGHLAVFTDVPIILHPLLNFRTMQIGRFAKRQTIQLLLEFGADPDLQLSTPFRSSTILSLLLNVEYFDSCFDVASDLIQAGVSIKEEDLKNFRFFSRLGGDESEIMRHLKDNAGLTRFLDMLSPKATEDTNRLALYRITMDFLKSMKSWSDLNLVQPFELSKEDMLEFVESLIANNDAAGMGEFLQNQWSDGLLNLNSIIPRCSLIHIAVLENSLDILRLCLEGGCNPNIQDQDGVYPVHLCSRNESRDTLQMLLQHGASTMVHGRESETIWHKSAKTNSTSILDVLIQQKDRDKALKMQSNEHATPIVTALLQGNKEAVLILVEYCNAVEDWKSDSPLFRAAAELGSSKIIQKMLDIGIDLDEVEANSGNPLHYLAPEADPECVQRLRQHFPADQRRKEDDATPAEAILFRAAANNLKLNQEVFTSLIPDSVLSIPREANRLWTFICSEIVPLIIDSPVKPTWLKDVFSFIIDEELVNLHQRKSENDSLSLLISAVVEETLRRERQFLQNKEAPSHLLQWNLFVSDILMPLMKNHGSWRSVKETDKVRLLWESIAHNNEQMIAALVDSGVDVHSKLDGMSPFDLACFHCVTMSEASFDLLTSCSRPEEINRGNARIWNGCGALHFTSAWRTPNPSILKLKRLLKAGANCNLPISTSEGPPITHHAFNGSVASTKVLLDAGADPWLKGMNTFDTPMSAIRCGSLSTIINIAAAVRGSRISTEWDRTYMIRDPNQVEFPGLFFGLNALHICAIYGRPEIMGFYLDERLFCDLDAGDDNLKTPMHYAAQRGYITIIELLKGSGANIDAADRWGYTPLHDAVRGQKLASVKTLLNMGAKQVPSLAGCTPLAEAYATANSSIIQVLNKSCDPSSNGLIRDPRGLKLMADALDMAIRDDDLGACQKLFDLGCPVEMILNNTIYENPLMAAIRQQKSPTLVKWLLQKGADVSRVFEPIRPNSYSTALEAAAANATYNAVLPEMVTRYFEHGGEFHSLPTSPIHTAIRSGNIEGLNILVNTLKHGHTLRFIMTRTDKHHEEYDDILSVCVNQPNAYTGDTPLHIAAQTSRISACQLLIQHNTNIERRNNHGHSALHLSCATGHAEVTEYLLNHGADCNALGHGGETPLSLAVFNSKWDTVQLLLEKSKPAMTTTSSGKNILHLMSRTGFYRRCSLNIRIFKHFMDAGVDLYHEDIMGVSAVNWVFANPNATTLQFLLNKDTSLIQVWRVNWPNAHFFPTLAPGNHYVALSSIAKNLQLIKRFHSDKEMLHISDLEVLGKHNLFCYAACLGVVDAIENFLLLGADIEQQCNEHGTPLNAAFSNHQYEAVMCLSNKGARIPGNILRPLRQGAEKVHKNSVMLHWLLRGRFSGMGKLGQNSSNQTEGVKFWSGVVMVRVVLKLEWRKLPGETMLAYARRRHSIIRGLRGKVVKVSM